MAWIEVHQSLSNHRKTLALADLLDIPPVHAMGHLVALWLWSIDNAPNGRLDKVKARTIALAAQWTGDPTSFLDALTEAGFIEADGDGFVIHDWMDYAGRLVERRAENAKRMRDARAKNRPHVIEERAMNVQDTCDARAGATVPNRTIPDHESITHVIDDATPPKRDETSSNAAHAAPPSGGKQSSRSTKKKDDAPSHPGFQGMWGKYVNRLGGSPATPSEQKRWADPIKEQLAAGITSDMVDGLIDTYEELFPGAICNPRAIANNLTTLRNPPQRRTNGHVEPKPMTGDEIRALREAQDAECLKNTIPTNYPRTTTNGLSSRPASSTSSRTSPSKFGSG